MMECRSNFRKRLWQCILSLAMFVGLTTYALAEPSPKPSKDKMLRFDAIIELNAPLCRTYVVLFARYWVSPESYRAAVVWAEPHAASLNFPMYPPTLNLVSDPNSFSIAHQFQHMYDGVFPKPLGKRGVFRHTFNVYYVSDIRFAEQEALNLRIHASDIQPLNETGADAEQVFDVSAQRGSDQCRREPAQVRVRGSKDRIDELRLLDAEGELLKSVQYEYTQQKGTRLLHRQNVLLPERPITVAFKGKAPTITIAGEKRRYSQLETTHHEGGRKCIVDYQPVEIGGRVVPLPVHITVYLGDGNRVLRSARLYNFTHCEQSPDQVKKSAEQFSLFDSNERKCRELLLKYWLKEPTDVNQADVAILQQLRTHFANQSVASMTVGQQIRRANVLLQLDWMLGRASGLEKHFQQYLSLLTVNDLGRTALFGGQTTIETTIRWGYFNAADDLLETWLDVALSRNDVEAVLDFAATSLRKGQLWTVAKLMDKVLQTSEISPPQRFVAQALRCKALAQIYAMVKNPDYIKTELGVAQARWALSHMSAGPLYKQVRHNVDEAKRLFTRLDEPTREHKAFREELESVYFEMQKVHDD